MGFLQTNRLARRLQHLLLLIMALLVIVPALSIGVQSAHAQLNHLSRANHIADVSYNRDAAVQYANTWGNQFSNDDGKYYYSVSDREDCTHFVSRALKQGGIDDTGTTDPNGITNANTLAQWLVKNNLSSRPLVEYSSISSLPEPPSGLQKGDIILYAWAGLTGDSLGNSAWDHAAIVVSGSGNSSVVAEHSFDAQGTHNHVSEPWYDWNITGHTTYGFLLINAGSTTIDNAQFISQSQFPTVSPNQSFQISFTLKNTGNTTWSDSAGYKLANTMTPLGASNAGFNGHNVAFGGQWTFTMNMTAPASSGQYNTVWRLMHNNAPFGPGLNIFVTVQQPGSPQLTPTHPPVPGATPTQTSLPVSTPSPTSQVRFTRPPVVANNTDKRMVAFAIGSDTQLYTKQEDSNGNWSSWISLGGSWPGQPAIGLNSNGVMEIFIAGGQGPNGATLFHAWQTSPGGSSWTDWQPLAGNWPAGTPAVTHNLSGGLEVFMRGRDTNLYHAWQTTSGSSSNYSGWYPMGGYWNTDPVVANNSDGTIQVFMVGESRELYYDQESTQGSWSGWLSLGGNWPGQPAVTLNSSGELEVFIVGNQGPNEAYLFSSWQTSPGSSTWALNSGGGWNNLPGYWPAGNPAVILNQGNNLMDVFSSTNGTLSHDWMTSTWNGPQSLGGSIVGQPALSINLGGGIEVFALGTDGQIYHCWETSSGNSSNYSSWVEL